MKKFFQFLPLLLLNCFSNNFNMNLKQKGFEKISNQFEFKEIMEIDELIKKTEKKLNDSSLEGENYYRDYYPLHYAIYSSKGSEEFQKNIKNILRLKKFVSDISFKFILNGIDSNGLTPLQTAILLKRDINIINEILNLEDINLEMKTAIGHYNLWILFVYKYSCLDLEAIKIIQQKSEEFIKERKFSKALDSNFASACSHAALKNNEGWVKFFTEGSYEPALNEVNPLMLACLNNNESLIEYLISLHINWKNCTDKYGRNFLHYIFMNSSLNIAKVVLKSEELPIAELNKFLEVEDCYGKKPLNYAFDYENYKIIYEFLDIYKRGKKLEVNLNDENCLFYLALKNDKVDIIKEFLKDFNLEQTKNVKGSNLLHLAIGLKSINVSNYLLKKIVKVEETDIEGNNYLHLIALNSIEDEGFLQNIFSLYKDKEEVNRENKNNNTPLYISVLNNNRNLVSKFLKFFSNINPNNLKKAKKCCHNNEDMLKMFEQYKFRNLFNQQLEILKLKDFIKEKNLEKLNSFKNNPYYKNYIEKRELLKLSSKDYKNFMMEAQFLVENLNEFQGMQNYFVNFFTYITEMKKEDNKDMLSQEKNINESIELEEKIKITNSIIYNEDELKRYKSLLKETSEKKIKKEELKYYREILDKINKRELNFSLRLENKNSALYEAIEKGYLEVIKLLLRNEENINLNIDELANLDGEKAVHIATEKDNKEALNLLFSEGGAYIGSINNKRENILHKAVIANLGSMLEMILEKLNDRNKDEIINQMDNNGKTALYLAVESNNEVLLQLLLKHKANPNIKKETENTPLHVAIKNKNYNIIKLLSDSKADWKIIGKEGKSCEEIAKEEDINIQEFSLNKDQLKLSEKKETQVPQRIEAIKL